MSVVVKHAIVHELVKDQNRAIVKEEQKISQDLLLVSDPDVIALVNRIQEIYGTRENSCDYGIFSAGGREGRFPQSYKTFVDDADSFRDLTHTFMRELITEADKEDWSTGGYVVCADYALNGQDFLTIAMIKKSKEFRFTETLKPQQITAINLKKLHQAVRINRARFVSRPQDEDGLAEYNYLSFISEGSDGAAKYFISAAGCQKGTSSKKATDRVYAYIQQKFSENASLTSKTIAAKDTLTELFEAKIEAQKPVTLSDITTMLKARFSDQFADPQESERFFSELQPEMNRDGVEIPNTFSPHPLAVTARKRIKYAKAGISISIDTDVIDSNNRASMVFWDSQNGKLIISADPKLREEIEQKVTGENA